MPDPIPVIVLGRLAIDPRFQSRGIGPGLLRDAVPRTLQASEIAGIRTILVHAIPERARQFYEEWGFVASPAGRKTADDYGHGSREGVGREIEIRPAPLSHQ
jgi:GNAT superfamily N-acetyltransferase